MLRSERLVRGACVALAIAGCGSGSTDPSRAPARLVFVSESALIGLHGSATLAPIVLDANDKSLPSEGITWTSSDPTIAPVDDAGSVSGITLGGPVTITATIGEISATIAVRVVPGQVLISPSITTLVVGTAVQLSAQVLDALGDPLPGLPVTWTNSTPGVASLDPSTLVLTGLTSGNAHVSATAGGRESAIGVLVGVPTEFDGSFASDAAASTYVQVDVVFGRVTRFLGTFRPMSSCSVAVNVSPNAAIGDIPPFMNRFEFGTGIASSTISGTFSTPHTINGSITGIPLASTSCGPTSGSLFTTYAASRL